MASEGTLCSGTGARPRPGWLRGCLLFSQGRFFSRDMPRSSPGPSNPFRRSATLCRLTGPPTVYVPGLLETEPPKTLSTHAPLPGVGCAASAPRWLQSPLCPLRLHPAPVSGSMATLTTSVILRPSGWGQPPPSPRCRAREQRSETRSHGAARAARAEGPAAAPRRPGFQARNQPVRPWQWTYLSYCEDLFMKNLEGEGARPQERVVFVPSLFPAGHQLPGPLLPTPRAPSRPWQPLSRPLPCFSRA